MSLYAQARKGGRDSEDLTPKTVDKLMNKKSWDIPKRKARVLDENPGSYVISWMEVLTCCWTYMKTHYETRGIFPPSFMIDHKNAPETDTFRTGAQVNTAWRVWRNSAGKATQIVPSYFEVRIYVKNVMKIVYDNFGHTLPEPAMMAYMCNTALHEFRHYVKYYDFSYDCDVAADKGLDALSEAVTKMDEFIRDRDTTKDEYETERGAILDTLNYMQHCYLDHNIGIASDYIDPIPGGPYDLYLREKYKHNANYRMASLMCEYLWVCLHEDFSENLTDSDYAELRLHKKKIVHEFRKYTQKHPTKMLIID